MLSEIKQQDIVAIIPARLGSKGIKKKNTQKIHGKPLIEYTFDAANKSKYIDASYITTDDEAAIKLAATNNIGSLFVRPEYLSTDDASTVDVVVHFLNQYLNEYHVYPKSFILLQPTSPLRDNNDIDNAILKYNSTKSNSLFSASKVLQHPYEMFHQKNNGKLDFFYRRYHDVQTKARQYYQEVYFEDGAIYICDTEWFLHTKQFFDESSDIYILQQEHAIDIDEPIDLEMAKLLLKK